MSLPKRITLLALLALALRVEGRNLQAAAKPNNFGQKNSQCAKDATAQTELPCKDLEVGMVCGDSKKCFGVDVCPALVNNGGDHPVHLAKLCKECMADSDCDQNNCQTCSNFQCVTTCSADQECRDAECKAKLVDIKPVPELVAYDYSRPGTSQPVPDGEWGVSFARPGATAAVVDLTSQVPAARRRLSTYEAGLLADPPGHTSAVRIAINGSSSAKVDVSIAFSAGLFEGMKFADFAKVATLQYDWFKSPKSADGVTAPAAPAPTLKFEVASLAACAPDATTGACTGTNYWTTFIYEPYQNPTMNTPQTGVWKTEAITAASGSTAAITLAGQSQGGWWQTAIGPVTSPPQKGVSGPLRSLQTWGAHFEATQPLLMSDAVITKVIVGMGSGNPNQLGYVQGVRLTAGAYDWSWDFGA